mmetsp:Transcript_14259/g.19817  ORF Transcript_14259/g.19817 Transcript_14259/m.19817 type:complete len:195 (+) Transcript_14259:194-778(+)
MQQGSVGRTFLSKFVGRSRLSRRGMAGTALNTPERVTACGYVNRRLLIRSLPTSYYLRKPQCCYHQPKSIHSATTATAATAVKRSSSSSYPTKKDRQRDEHHRYIISERSREIDGFHNNSIKATRTNIDSKQFLQERGRGAYTTARTVGRTKVFDLDAHLNRTADNLTAITAEKRLSLRLSASWPPQSKLSYKE